MEPGEQPVQALGHHLARRTGQRALARRVSMNVAALDGRYTPELELDPA